MGTESIGPKKENRNLVCILTDDELDLARDEIARVTSEQERLEDEKKSVTSSYKDKIDRCVLDMRTIARKITTKQEVRGVECVWEFDYRKAMATLIRPDTGEVVDKRAMTAEELQYKLPKAAGK